jgi:hypothetical protein
MSISTLEMQALSLPAEQRAALAHRLLLSLDESTDAELERIWGEASAQRAAAADAAGETSIPGEIVAQRARALLR